MLDLRFKESEMMPEKKLKGLKKKGEGTVVVFNDEGERVSYL